MKPPIIDGLMAVQTMTKSGKWVILAPLEMYGLWRYINRIHHAYLVLRGKARAVTFIDPNP